MSTPIYWTARVRYDGPSGGVERIRSDDGLCAGFGLPFINLPSLSVSAVTAERARRVARRRELQKPTGSPDYRTAVRACLKAIWWKYVHPWPMIFLPTNEFTLFLLGLRGLRIGVFEGPREHWRLIAGLMVSARCVR